MDLLAPLLMADISKLPEEAICSLHYVADTLKASIWCFMNTDNYKDAVLKAVNLGHDTDTTAAVTGELAGLYYGFESIPEKWINEIRRSNDINDLCNRFTKAMGY